MIFLFEGFISQAFELEGFSAEVDQQANFQIIGFQIIDRLSQVHILQLDKGF